MHPITAYQDQKTLRFRIPKKLAKEMKWQEEKNFILERGEDTLSSSLILTPFNKQNEDGIIIRLERILREEVGEEFDRLKKFIKILK